MAVHAEHAQREPAVGGVAPEAGEGVSEGDASEGGEAAEQAGRGGAAAADVEHGKKASLRTRGRSAAKASPCSWRRRWLVTEGGASQGLVDRHGGAAPVREHVRHPAALQGLHQRDGEALRHGGRSERAGEGRRRRRAWGRREFSCCG